MRLGVSFFTIHLVGFIHRSRSALLLSQAVKGQAPPSLPASITRCRNALVRSSRGVLKI